MLSRKQSQFYSSYCGSSEKVITLALQASIASSNLVSRTKSHTFYPLKLVGQSMAWLSHARWTTILKSMKDCQQAVCLAPSWLTHTCQCSRHELTDGKQPSHVNAKQKAESTGVFLSTLLLLRVFVWTAPRRWEWRNTGLFLLGILFEFLFEYMSYFPYLYLSILTKICSLIWIYVVLPFAQTFRTRKHWMLQFEYMSYCLLITLKGNSQFECMSYYLLPKLPPFNACSRFGLNICCIAF